MEKNKSSLRKTIPNKITNSKEELLPNLKHFSILLFLVSIITLIVHFPALYTDARAFDHEVYLTDNHLITKPSVESALTIVKEVLRPTAVNGYYQPISMISLMVDYAIAKSDKVLFVFHTTSLIFHILFIS